MLQEREGIADVSQTAEEHIPRTETSPEARSDIRSGGAELRATRRRTSSADATPSVGQRPPCCKEGEAHS